MFSAGTTDIHLIPRDISHRAHISLRQRVYTKQVQTISESVGWLCVQRRVFKWIKHSGDSAFKRNAEGEFNSQKVPPAAFFENAPQKIGLVIKLVFKNFSKIFSNLAPLPVGQA